MKGRQLPWIVAAIALIAFIASFSELQRMRRRFGEVTHHQFHDHQDVRRYIIKAAMADLDHPIVVIGDSITEMARFPKTIGDRPVVNAGIGGASIEDFEVLAPGLLENANPSLIVVALGTNDDATAIGRHYAALLLSLKRISPRLLAVSVTPQGGADLKNEQIEDAAARAGVPLIRIKLPDGSLLPDDLHLNGSGYQKWIPALVAAISDALA
jgi:lysophospholipase L1-like esterase